MKDLCSKCWFYHVELVKNGADDGTIERCERGKPLHPTLSCRDYVLEREFHEDEQEGE